MPRLSFDIILLLSLFLLPWWLSGLLAVAGLFIFKEYYEFVLAAIVIYGLYMAPGIWLISQAAPYSIIISLFYLAVQAFRQSIILYKNEISY